MPPKMPTEPIQRLTMNKKNLWPYYRALKRFRATEEPFSDSRCQDVSFNWNDAMLFSKHTFNCDVNFKMEVCILVVKLKNEFLNFNDSNRKSKRRYRNAPDVWIILELSTLVLKKSF